MKNELDEIMYGINQDLKPNILKSFIALKSGNEYVQISTYDGMTNSMRDDQEGIAFIIDEKMRKIINVNNYFSREINVKDYKSDFWWILSDLKYEKVNLYVRYLYKPLINKLEQTGMIVFISIENLTNEINEILDNEFMLINEASYEMFKKYENKNIIRVFINSMIKILRQDHPNIYSHSLRTSDLATLIAQSIHLDNDQIEKIRNAALIHDFGKIFLNEDYLTKFKDMKNIEKKEYKIHIEKLFDLFKNNPYMEGILNIAYKHHEKPNGQGYYGLKKEQLNILDNILIISNVFDILFQNKDKFNSIKEVLDEMQKMADRDEIDKEIFKNTKEIIISFYGGMDNFSTINSISYTKDIYIQDPVKNEELHKALIINSIGNMIIINFQKNPDFNLGRKIKFICDIGGIVEKFNAKIISKTENDYTLILDVEKSKKAKTVKIFWNRGAELHKLPYDINSFEDIDIHKTLVGEITIRKLGGNELNFITDEEIAMGAKRMIFFEYGGEKIFIPGIISNKLEEQNEKIYFFEYLDMNDKDASKIYRAIFKKQVEMRMKI